MQTMSRQELNAMVGCALVGPGGEKLGKITDVYVDERTRQPEWLAVSTGMFGLKESFVPLSGVQRRGNEYESRFSKDQVKGAPISEAEGALSPDEEDQLYRHYGKNPPTTSPPTSAAGPGPAEAGRSRTGRQDAMTRSEEELRVGKATEQRGQARLRKWVETEHVSDTVPVAREEARIVREPITEQNQDRAMSGPDIREDTHEVTLSEERVVVGKETVPRERVRLEKETIMEERPVEADLRKEHIEVEGDPDTGRARRR
jgi:uncharacterized protein (TIGR02271 family)